MGIKTIKAGKKKYKVVCTTLCIYSGFMNLKNIRHDVNYYRVLLIFFIFLVTAQQNTVVGCQFSVVFCLVLCVIGS